MVARDRAGPEGMSAAQQAAKLVNVAFSLMDAGRMDEAIKAFEKAVGVDPDSIEVDQLSITLL